MQFVGDFVGNPQLCDRLVELHRVCDRRGIVKRGGVGRGGKMVVDVAKN